jgi:hypothetical protein
MYCIGMMLEDMMIVVFSFQILEGLVFQDMSKWKPKNGTRFLIEAPKSKGIFTYLKRHNNRS